MHDIGAGGPLDFSEIALVERIAGAVGRRPGVALGIGDDAAVLAGEPPLVLTQDLLVDGVHFTRGAMTLRELGHKALAVNLSDIAAMGAAPVAALVGLVLPRRDRLGGADIDELYAGMEHLADRFGTSVAGGDTVTGPALVLSVTAIGRMAPGVEPVLRSGARPGDLVCVTGELGAAAAGLLVQGDPLLASGLDDAAARSLRAAQVTPEPRIAAGLALAAGGAHAMLDCSDGLALDTLRLARASGVCVELHLDRLPIADGVERVAAAAGREADVLAATGGEDYELVVTVDPADHERLSFALDVPLTVVGNVRAGSPGVRLLREGREVTVPRLGYEHGA